MQVELEYTVTYESGETRSSINASSANLTEEQFSRLVRAIKEKPELDDREELSDIIAELSAQGQHRGRFSVLTKQHRCDMIQQGDEYAKACKETGRKRNLSYHAAWDRSTAYL